MNRALWIVQILLAALFLWAGGLKLAMPVEEMTAQVAFPGAFLRFIGVVEVLGALGLILPGLTHVRPGLTPLAATGLVVVMIGATAVTATAMGFAVALVPFVTGLLAAFVAIGRGRVVPLRGASGRRESLQSARP